MIGDLQGVLGRLRRIPAPPYPAGLGPEGGIAQKQGFQRLPVKGEQRPEVAVASVSGGGSVRCIVFDFENGRTIRYGF